MRDDRVVEWAAHVSEADYTLYKQDNLTNSVSLQKSDTIRSYSTSFYLADGTWLRSLHGSGDFWGYGSATLGGNEFEQPLPDKVQVTYLDKIANQYYQGEHLLPTAKIYALMTSTDRKQIDSNPGSDSADKNYYAIELGFAPKGWVIVFVTGWSGRKEITSFQATPIEPDSATIEGEKISSGDDYLLIDYEYYLKNKDVSKNDNLAAFKNKSPKGYEQWQSGEWTISSEWYKQMQTKYPWNLSITIDGQEWNGEYYAEFANTERFAVLDDQFDKYSKALKAVPTKIITWVDNKGTGERIEVEVHLFPRPQWAAQGTGKASYRPYYQDPNLNYFFKYFDSLYPKRSLATNEQPANANEFATLKLDFDKDLVLENAYLQKDNQVISIGGAYQFSRAPIDPTQGQYVAKSGYPQFITAPKIKNLSDPAFVNIN